jgi:hypothetical protein
MKQWSKRPNHRATTPRGTPVPSENGIEEAATYGTRECQRTVPRLVGYLDVKRANVAGRTDGPRSVETLLRHLETLAQQRLDGIGSARDDAVAVLVRLERREHVVGDVAWVSSTRPTHSDSQP